MTAPRRLPIDAGSMRVERWLAERRDATPPPDPGRVLERVIADLAKSTQHHGGRAAAENLADQPLYPGRDRRHGGAVGLPPATVGLALLSSIALFVALVGAVLFLGASMQRQGSEAIVPGAVSASAPAVELTPEPRTVVRTDILLGVSLEVEEVEPGVMRVVSDGIRDLAWERSTVGRYPARFSGGTIVAGHDGSVWSVTYPAGAPSDECADPCTLIYRLGSNETLRGPSPECGVYGCFRDDMFAGGDGTLWAIWPLGDGDELRVFDGSEWATRRKLPAKGQLLQATLDRQNDVWASWRTPKGQPRVGHLTDDGWQVHKPQSMPDNGLIPHALRGAVIFHEDGTATRLPDGIEQGMRALGDGSEALPVAGDDGGYWWLAESAPGLRQLIRSDGLDSTAFEVSDEIGSRPEVLGASADGSVWMRPNAGPGCDGLARFDGRSWTTYLPGACITSISFGIDGSVWLQDSAKPQVETYIIRPAEAG